MASGSGARQPRRGAAQGADAVLKSLRWKFVGLTMAAVTLVLVATFATICYLDYRQNVDTVYEQLEMTAGRHLVPGHGRFGGPHGEGDDAEGVFPPMRRSARCPRKSAAPAEGRSRCRRRFTERTRRAPRGRPAWTAQRRAATAWDWPLPAILRGPMGAPSP